MQAVTAFQLHETLLFLYREIVHHLARSDEDSTIIFEYLLKGARKKVFFYLRSKLFQLLYFLSGIECALTTSNLKIAAKYVKYTQDFMEFYESSNPFYKGNAFDQINEAMVKAYIITNNEYIS